MRPDLRNLSYDGFLRLELPGSSFQSPFVVGYADDIATVIVARNAEEDQRKLNRVLLLQLALGCKLTV